MTENIWIQLADRANELLSRPDVDGLVITHGTDTMEETAYFLQLTVRSYKPIILTGAMRPATAISADGPLNLMDAVRVAANPAAWNKGVLVVMNGQIDSAREVTKTHTTVVNTFQSPGLGSLGMVNDGQPAFYRDILKRHTADSLFEVKGLSQLPRVKIIYGCTNNDTLFAEAAIKAGVDGIIYAGMGNGSITKSEEAVLAQAAEQGIVVVRSTRCMGSGHSRRSFLYNGAFS
jgi:L-asparaginase